MSKLEILRYESKPAGPGRKLPTQRNASTQEGGGREPYPPPKTPPYSLTLHLHEGGNGILTEPHPGRLSPVEGYICMGILRRGTRPGRTESRAVLGSERERGRRGGRRLSAPRKRKVRRAAEEPSLVTVIYGNEESEWH